MNKILLQLKNKNLLNVDEIEIPIENFGKHRNMITYWAKKKIGSTSRNLIFIINSKYYTNQYTYGMLCFSITFSIS